MLDLEGQALTPRERDLLQRPGVGGVIFFARNAGSRGQIADLAAAVRDVRPDILLAVDQEGGRVQRFRDGYTRFPPMAVLGRLLEHRPEEGEQLLRDCGWLLAAEVIASGLDFSFTPVLDVDDRHCEVIADRAFAADPGAVAVAAGHFVDGLHEAGMAATGKHFPGHGGVSADSHLETPTDGRSLAQLESRDLIPFRALASRLDAVMPAHILFPGVDGHCVGFSRRWLEDILRRDLGFDGVIFSDDLSMKGADVAGGYAEKAAAALGAGCDMVLVCNDPEGAVTVLDYLGATGFETPARLPAMAARRPWSWEELEDSPRRAAVLKALRTLDDSVSAEGEWSS